MSRGLSCNIALFLFIAAPPALLFAGALLVSLIPLPHALDRSRNLVAAVGCGTLGGVYLVVLAGLLIWWLLSYPQNADPAFARPGLEASAYALFGRQYHGQTHGRSADAYYIPPHRLNPGSLEVHLCTTLQTRLTISTGRPLHGCEGCQPLDLGDPELARLR